MRVPVQFLSVIGGKNDGALLRCNQIWWADPEHLHNITYKLDGELHRVDRIEGDKAILVHNTVPKT